VRRQPVANVPEDHQSVSHDEAANDTSPPTATDQNPITPNDVVDITPTSGLDVVQGAPALPAQPAQFVQPSNQVAPIAPPSIAAPPAADAHENSGTVPGKRRQSDASFTPTLKKRTKTNDPDTVPGANNNEILGSTTEPQPSLNESTHSDDTCPAPVSEDETSRLTPDRDQTAPNVEDETHDPQRQEVDNARNSTDNSHTTPEHELRRPQDYTPRWPSDSDDHDAFEALVYIEDPERQESLAENHTARTIKLSKALRQKAFDKVSTKRFNEADGWIKSKAYSQAQGTREIGLVAQYPVPVLRGDPRPPKPNAVFWVPGPDKMKIMCKLCIGLIVVNGLNIKLTKHFTTKSGTDPEALRRSGDLQYYYQVIRSPQEDHVRIEEGVAGVFKFESFTDQGVKWDIDGPRLMESMALYELPPGAWYRILGQLKHGGYDEDLLINMWKKNAAILERETRRAFRERIENPDYVRRYRNVAQLNIGDDTVVAQVSLFRIPFGGLCFCTNVVTVACVADRR
jgi:hypothetical protein